jgi:hypothetical protein
MRNEGGEGERTSRGTKKGRGKDRKEGRERGGS